MIPMTSSLPHTSARDYSITAIRRCFGHNGVKSGYLILSHSFPLPSRITLTDKCYINFITLLLLHRLWRIIVCSEICHKSLLFIDFDYSLLIDLKDFNSIAIWLNCSFQLFRMQWIVFLSKLVFEEFLAPIWAKVCFQWKRILVNLACNLISFSNHRFVVHFLCHSLLENYQR